MALRSRLRLRSRRGRVRGRTVAAAAFAALLAGVCGGCSGSDDPDADPQRPSSSAAEPSNEQDRIYLVAAHQLHLTEVEAGRVALAAAASEAVREDAARFIADHTRLDTDLVDVASQLGVPLPEEPSEQQQAELEAVAGITDGSFDAAWLAQRVAAHEQEEALLEAQRTGGLSPLVDRLVTEADAVHGAHVAELTGQPVPDDPVLGAPVPAAPDTATATETATASPAPTPTASETETETVTPTATVVPVPPPSTAEPPASVGAGFPLPGGGRTGPPAGALAVALVLGGGLVAVIGLGLVVRDRRHGGGAR